MASFMPPLEQYLYSCLHTSTAKPLTAPGPAALLWAAWLLRLLSCLPLASTPGSLFYTSPAEKPAPITFISPRQSRIVTKPKVPINSQQSGQSQ